MCRLHRSRPPAFISSASISQISGNLTFFIILKAAVTSEVLIVQTKTWSNDLRLAMISLVANIPVMIHFSVINRLTHIRNSSISTSQKQLKLARKHATSVLQTTQSSKLEKKILQKNSIPLSVSVHQLNCFTTVYSRTDSNTV